MHIDLSFDTYPYSHKKKAEKRRLSRTDARNFDLNARADAGIGLKSEKETVQIQGESMERDGQQNARWRAPGANTHILTAMTGAKLSKPFYRFKIPSASPLAILIGS